MLYLHCTIRTVAAQPVKETDRTTGEMKPDAWTIQVEHTNDKGDLVLEKLKAKTVAQAEAWRKLIGKTVTVPVNTTANNGKVYLWLREGQLPQVQGEQPLKAAA